MRILMEVKLEVLPSQISALHAKWQSKKSSLCHLTARACSPFDNKSPNSPIFQATFLYNVTFCSLFELFLTYLLPFNWNNQRVSSLNSESVVKASGRSTVQLEAVDEHQLDTFIDSSIISWTGFYELTVLFTMSLVWISAKVIRLGRRNIQIMGEKRYRESLELSN